MGTNHDITAHVTVLGGNIATGGAAVDADKVRAKAEALVKGSRERANAETILAKARAASEKTKERIARLVSHQENLQRIAVKDWDARLYKNPEEGFEP